MIYHLLLGSLSRSNKSLLFFIITIILNSQLKFIDPYPTSKILEQSSSFFPKNLATNNSTLAFPSFFFPLTEGKPGYYFWRFYPEQVHISWTENENEICILWATYFDLDSWISYRPLLVPHGFSSSDWKTLKPKTRVFDEKREMIRIQYIHEIILKDLNSDLIYEYRLGNGFFWSEIFTFSGRSPSLKIVKNAMTKMLIIGDLGIGILGSETTQRIVSDLKVSRVDGVFHLGDIAYDLHERDGRGGDEFFNMIQPIAANYPYMVLPGNHETRLNYTQYRSRFRMPQNENNSNTNWFYSVNMGTTHFVVINTELYFSKTQNFSTEVQKNWLVNDLQKANENRKNFPWVIVMMHRPLYCSVDYSQMNPCQYSIECCSEAEFLRSHLEDIFYEYHVDLVLQAHQHNYERNFPIYLNLSVVSEIDSKNWMYNPQAPIYVTTGNAGNYEAGNDPLSKTPQLWQAFSSQNYGYGKLEIYNSTHLYYEQIDSVQRKIIDYFFVVKEIK